MFIEPYFFVESDLCSHGRGIISRDLLRIINHSCQDCESIIACLLLGWSLGLVNEPRKIQGAVSIMFLTLLLVSFIARRPKTSNRTIYPATYPFHT